MLPRRKIKLSTKEAVSSLFASPPAGSGLAVAYNVYGEVELRNGKYKPEWPWLYIIDTQVKFTVMNLPLIVVNLGRATKYEHQIGDRTPRRLYTAELSVLGRNRGEREDLVDFITENLTVIPIKDYDQDGSPVVATAEVDPVVSEIPVSVGPEESKEGTLLNWIDVQFSFRVDAWW